MDLLRHGLPFNSRVVVCGGRGFGDIDLFDYVMRGVDPKLIIHGNATGADALADSWADAYHIPKLVYKPDRSLDGPGRDWKFRRNERMLRESSPTMVVAFPGGPGTAHTISVARKSGIPVAHIPIRTVPL